MKKERITSNKEALIEKAQKEIDAFTIKQENILCYFSELPSIAGFPFKIIVFQNKEGEFHSQFRQWDTAYDFDRWHLGVYNLDRLRIIEQEIQLSAKQQQNLHQILKNLSSQQLPTSIDKKNVITLDVSEFKLGIHLPNLQGDYTWRVATKEIELFIPLIDLLLSLHENINQRKL